MKYIQVDSGELALVVAEYLRTTGLEVDVNITVGVQWDNKYFWNNEVWVLGFYDKRVTWETHILKPGYPILSTFAEVLAELKNLAPTPIRIGEYEVKSSVSGIAVGCTFVPWETVREVAALEKKV